ncbi:Uncharacterised protein [Segatella copri]|jgi:hypothetical protein|nr:Uncharacterised protein [Segatella copri]
MLNVDCSDNIDACFKQFHDILPSFFMPASFHIGVRKFIYHYQFWV